MITLSPSSSSRHRHSPQGHPCAITSFHLRTLYRGPHRLSSKRVSWNESPLAVRIQLAFVFGNWNAITPPFQPAACAWSMHVPSVSGSMNPFVASLALLGLPITSLLRLDPSFGISSGGAREWCTRGGDEARADGVQILVVELDVVLRTNVV